MQDCVGFLSARVLNLRSPRPEMNALPLDKLATVFWANYYFFANILISSFICKKKNFEDWIFSIARFLNFLIFMFS